MMPQFQTELERELYEALETLANVIDGQPLPEPEQGERIEAAVGQAFAALRKARGRA